MDPTARLIAIPLVLLAAAAACGALASRRQGWASTVAAVAIAVVAVDALSLLPLVNGGGTIDLPRYTLIPGVDLAFRADSTALVVVALAAVAAFAWALEPRRHPAERAFLLVCLLGTGLCALAGNGVLLFGGLEVANVGAFLLANGSPREAGAPQRAGFIASHVGALLLLLAVLRVQGDAGTSDLVALPAMRLQNGLAGYWVAAGAIRVLAVGGLGPAAHRFGSPAWASVAAVPTGAVVLLRLVQVNEGVMPGQVVVFGCAVGVTAGLVGGCQALRYHRTPSAAGRWLCVAAAAPLVTLTVLPSEGALVAFAVCLLAAMLAAATAAAWLPDGHHVHPGRGLRAAALVTCSALPVGAGFVAMHSALAEATSIGAHGAAVAAGLALGWAASAAAGVLSVRAVLSETPERAPAAGHPVTGLAGLLAQRRQAITVLAVAVSLAVAIAPGTALRLLAGPLTGGVGGQVPIDALALRGPGGGWAGGYLLLPLVVILGALWSASVLLGHPLIAPSDAPGRTGAGVVRSVPGAVSSESAVEGPAGWRGALRRLGPHADRLLLGVDRWSVGQPNLVTAAILAVVCLNVFR